jgi:hypothetical protein
VWICGSYSCGFSDAPCLVGFETPVEYAFKNLFRIENKEYKWGRQEKQVIMCSLAANKKEFKYSSALNEKWFISMKKSFPLG